MRVRIRLYGFLRDLAGGDEHEIEVTGVDVDVATALVGLVERIPALDDHLPSCALAVGDEIVRRSHRLQSGDTLALLPPSAGG